MGGYLGPQPVPQAVIHKQRFPLASGQTSVATAGYIPGYVNAWLNGQRLDEFDDFTATNGSDVVLTVGGSADGLDVLVIEALVPFQVLNQYFTGTTKLDALNVLGPSSFGNEITVVGGKFGANANFGAYIIPKAGGAMGDFTVADPTGNPRLSVDSVGRVTAPYQPAFATQGMTGTVTLSATPVKLPFGSAYLNRGSGYSNAQYTAPVTGVYDIEAFVLTINGSASTPQNVTLALYQNGANTGITGRTKSVLEDYAAVSGKIFLQANDTVSIYASTDAAGTLYQSFCGFNGHLIG